MDVVKAPTSVVIEVHQGFPDVTVTIRCPQETAEIQRMVALLESLDRRITGVLDGETCVLATHDVLYAESVDKRCFLYTAAAVYETSLRLFELEDRYGDAGFFRASKSQIVNVGQISSLRPEFGSRLEVVMTNGERLIVSRQYAHMLKERLGLI